MRVRGYKSAKFESCGQQLCRRIVVCRFFFCWKEVCWGCCFPVGLTWLVNRDDCRSRPIIWFVDFHATATWRCTPISMWTSNWWVHITRTRIVEFCCCMPQLKTTFFIHSLNNTKRHIITNGTTHGGLVTKPTVSWCVRSMFFLATPDACFLHMRQSIDPGRRMDNSHTCPFFNERIFIEVGCANIVPDTFGYMPFTTAVSWQCVSRSTHTLYCYSVNSNPANTINAVTAIIGKCLVCVLVEHIFLECLTFHIFH